MKRSHYKNAIAAVLCMLTIWCSCNSANIGKLRDSNDSSNIAINGRTIAALMDRVIELEKHSHAPAIKPEVMETTIEQ